MRKIVVFLLPALIAAGFLCPACQKAPASVEAGGTDAGEQQSTGEMRTLLKREEPGHKTTVVIDPGHGFGDVGAAGPETPLGCYEYELTAEMGLTLRDYLEERGYIVYMTHDGSTFPSLSEIRALADQYGVAYDTEKSQWEDNHIFSPYEQVIYMNCLDAMVGVDFAISVHVNANAQSEDISGFDLDYCAQNDWSAESRVFAQALKDKLQSAYPDSNLWYYEDSWDEAFIVTKFNTMPSALLETGYYTNPEDVENLKKKSWRDSLMQRVAEAIDAVFTED